MSAYFLQKKHADALRLLAEGHNLISISQELHYSEHTLKHLMQEARALLGAQTNTQAVALAIRAGVIE